MARDGLCYRAPPPYPHYLVQSGDNLQVNSVVSLGFVEFPSAGSNQSHAKYIHDKILFLINTGSRVDEHALYLITSGPLEGSYVFVRAVYRSLYYVRVCSGSPLSAEYLRPDTSELIISDNLEIEMLLSPRGAYESFKALSNTFCVENHNLIIV